MASLINIAIGISVISFPLIFFLIYLKSLDKKAKSVTDSFKTEESERIDDITVWVKNFDIFKKNRKFDLDAYNTTYDFNICDLIINPASILIIGKMNFLGITKYLNPTVFIGGQNSSEVKPKTKRVVICQNIKHNGSDLEIDFKDPSYTNQMTLVLKNIDSGLMEKIIRATTKAQPQA